MASVNNVINLFKRKNLNEETGFLISFIAFVLQLSKIKNRMQSSSLLRKYLRCVIFFFANCKGKLTGSS